MSRISPVTGHYVTLEVDGLEYKVFYLENGDGQPLVCQHTAGNHQWRGLLVRRGGRGRDLAPRGWRSRAGTELARLALDVADSPQPGLATLGLLAHVPMRQAILDNSPSMCYIEPSS